MSETVVRELGAVLLIIGCGLTFNVIKQMLKEDKDE